MLSDIYCFHEVNYTIVLMNRINNVIVERIKVGSDNCQDGNCSIFLSPPVNETYRVGVRATSVYGMSNLSVFDTVICKLTLFNN